MKQRHLNQMGTFDEFKFVIYFEVLENDFLKLICLLFDDWMVKVEVEKEIVAVVEHEFDCSMCNPISFLNFVYTCLVGLHL